MPLMVRESAPPGPPPPFNPGRIPAGYEKAAKQQQELEEEHARMRPLEGHTTMGPRPIPPPAPLPASMFAAPPPVIQPLDAATQQRLALLDRLAAKLAILSIEGESDEATLQRLIDERRGKKKCR